MSSKSLKRSLDNQERDDEFNIKNNEGTSDSTSSRQKRVKVGFYPTDLLTFNFNRSSMELVWEDGDHDDNMKYFKGVLKAYQNYKDNFQNVGCQEVMVKTKRFLAIHGFSINTVEKMMMK